MVNLFKTGFRRNGKQPMKTVIIRSCLETLTPRAFKNAQGLAASGYDVVLLAWDRKAKSPKREVKDGYQARRFRFRAPYGLKVLIYLPVWWCFEFLWLMNNRWDIVHAMDFDTLPPAMLAARLKRKPVIYEIADVYEDMVALPSLIRNISMWVDRLFICLASAIIISDEARIKEFGGIPNDRITVIYNSPPDLFQEAGTPTGTGNEFTLFYSGALHEERQANLDKVARAIQDIDGIALVIAGYGNQTGQMTQWAAEAPGKIEFAGYTDYTETLQRTMAADVIISLYAPVLLNTRYASANKLFEAMMCGKPVLVSKGTAMADIVEKEHCGLALDPDNIDEIREAIAKLRENPGLYQQLGANGRKAYEQRYNWATMRQRLLNLYQEVAR